MNLCLERAHKHERQQDAYKARPFSDLVHEDLHMNFLICWTVLNSICLRDGVLW
jgi:hypothetical protein